VGGPVAASSDGGTVYIGVADFVDVHASEFITVALRA
jgi:hypothetical protein